jgi:nucleolar protein 56
MAYIYSNILGVFVFDKEISLIDEKRFKTVEDYHNKSDAEKVMLKKHKTAKKPSLKELKEILVFFKNEEYQKEFHQKNLKLTKKGIRDSISEDAIILNTITTITELDRVCNMLSKRLRRWYNLFLPELDHNISDHEKYAILVFTKSKKELIKEMKVEDTMGADLAKRDTDEIKALAKEVVELYNTRKEQEEYLEKVMKNYCPNLLELAGTMIGAKLLEHAKSLKRLALLPASTVQLLGAEKALFRHIKTGSLAPKHGVIITHPYVQKANRRNKGMAARLLAGKLSIAVKVDYFKGDYIADELKKEIEKKLSFDIGKPK